MTDSSTIDNDTSECPSDAVSFPLQEFPAEIREMVWIMAAEQAADAFRHKYPDFNRFWYTQHRPPYLFFTAHTIDNIGDPDPDPSIVRDLRDFFWPLFLVNTESHAIVSRYIILLHQRKKAPRLALNFVDVFPLRGDLLDSVIQFSSRSSDALRSKAGMGFCVRYPSVLQTAYEDQLEEVTLAMNVSIRAQIFKQSEADQARLSMLLRFRNLKRVYIDVSDLYRGELGYIKGREVGILVELSEFRNGKFKMKYKDFDSFSQAYKERCNSLSGNGDAREPTHPVAEVWNDVQA
ncbi:hypothetical protein GL218_05644 [Daldinia childiae]|uniref:uncharacterized protein n=1 Tax=Daldinia childiae TaxID=326645 RepID=UPI0014463A04|nr:uncharacterized protein GL218_05644 [Daldinia childiae]KAF3058316.1 hypothetical protein GL218_05644 [Daldinia childiae]